MIKNTASQRVGVQMISATDGSAFTGSVTVAVTVDAGTQATGSVGSGACTHEGGGYHTYAPAQAETNGDLVAFTFSGTGAVPQTVQVYTRAATPDVNVSTIAANAITAAAIASDAITAAKIANGAIDAATFAADVDAEILSYLVDDATRIDASALNTHSAITVAGIADGVWDEDATGHQTGGTFGQAIGDPAADTNTIYGAVVTGAAGATVAADIIAIKAETAAILDDTDDIGVAGAGLTEAGGTGDHLTALATQASVNTIDDLLDTEIGALTTAVADLPTNAELATALGTADDAVLAAIPSAATIADAVWDEAIAGHAGAGSTGEALSNAGAAGTPPTVSEIADAVWDEDIVAAHTTADSAGQILGDVATGTPPTAAAIADAVWDEATSGHTTSGTFGEQLKTDVDAILADTNELQTDWANGGRLDLLIDAILADTAELQTDWVNGGRLDLILDARASQSSVDDLPTNAELATALAGADDAVLAAIAALNNLSQANIRTAIGLASANLDTQLADLPTNAELATALGTADDAILAAIAALTIPTATENADALLKRDMSAVTGESARSPLNALRALRNKVSIAADVLTVTKEDDTTSAWTAAVTTTAGDPVSAVDPA